MVALLSDGYRYNEIVSVRVSVEMDEDGCFAEIIRNAVPSLYIYNWLRDWIKFAKLNPGDLLFHSKRSRNKSMTAIVLRELVRNWLCIMGCEAESDTVVSRFRRKCSHNATKPYWWLTEHLRVWGSVCLAVFTVPYWHRAVKIDEL